MSKCSVKIREKVGPNNSPIVHEEQMFRNNWSHSIFTIFHNRLVEDIRCQVPLALCIWFVNNLLVHDQLNCNIMLSLYTCLGINIVHKQQTSHQAEPLIRNWSCLNWTIINSEHVEAVKKQIQLAKSKLFRNEKGCNLLALRGDLGDC